MVRSVSIEDGGVDVKMIKTSVPEIGSIEREFALCQSGCLSSRAATMNYPINGIWYRKKPSLHTLQNMKKEDYCNKDEKIRELMNHTFGVDTCETDLRKRYISK
jgi:hypothetical protein